MKEISVKNMKLNPFTNFAKDRMALTAGNQKDGYNTMTVAWGHLGAIWERERHTNQLPTVICYVRPSRYTKEFLDKEPYFTLSYFGNDGKKLLGYLGTHSGRDEDKIKTVGLTPVFDCETTYFAEAKTVFICRKLYHAPILENGFVDKGLIDFNYPEKDFNEMYIGEIVKVLVNSEHE